MRQGRARSGVALSLTLGLLAGCRSTLPDGSPNPDPWEGFNRKVFAFNDTVDRWVLVPLAKGWHFVLPDAAETSVENVFQNLLWPISFVSNVLQAKFKDAGTETARFVINSTVGLLGLFDPAAAWGIEPRREDLGEAFGAWGIPPGPYLVLPLLGPSSPRDAVGNLADVPVAVYYFDGYAWAAATVDTVNWRALNLERIAKARERSFDWYVFVRNAYVQNREAKVGDQDTADPYAAPEPEDDLYNTDDDLYDLDFDEEPDPDEGSREPPARGAPAKAPRTLRP